MNEKRKIGRCLFQHKKAVIITKSDGCKATARKTRANERQAQRQKSEADDLLPATQVRQRKEENFL